MHMFLKVMIIIIIVETAECVPDRIIQIRNRPVDRVAVCIGGYSVSIDCKRCLLRIGHTMGWHDPVTLDKPLMARNGEQNAV